MAGASQVWHSSENPSSQQYKDLSEIMSMMSPSMTLDVWTRATPFWLLLVFFLMAKADITVNDFSAFLDMRRCKTWAHKILSWKYLTVWRPVLPVFSEHRVPHSWFPPWALSGVLKFISYGGSWLKLCRGRWQVPVSRSQGSHMVINLTIVLGGIS